MRLLAADSPAAVQQYVAPSFAVNWEYPGDDTLADSADPWDGVCQLMNIHSTGGFALALEGAIASPN